MPEQPTNARSRRTRSRLLAAARKLLERDGFDGLTISAVAAEAGVTRRAVYLHFATRGEIVAELFDYIAAEEGLTDSLTRVWEAPDAAAALDEWAQHLARYHVRLLAVDRAVERVRHDDEDAARHRARVVKAKLASCRRLAGRLADERRLARPWTPDTAADMLFALISSDVVEGLTVDRRWSRKQLAEHLGLLFRSTFLAPEPTKEAAR